MRAPSGSILPSLQPASWPERALALCEPLIGSDPRWGPGIALPWVCYGVDTGETFAPFEADPGRLVQLRAAARASLPGLHFDLARLEFDDLAVIDVHGSYFASESILDPARMRALQARLGCDMLAVGIPCRGHAYVTSGQQPEVALRRFVALIEQQHAAASSPIFAIPVLVQHGDLIGLLRLAADDEFEDAHTPLP